MRTRCRCSPSSHLSTMSPSQPELPTGTARWQALLLTVNGRTGSVRKHMFLRRRRAKHSVKIECSGILSALRGEWKGEGGAPKCKSQDTPRTSNRTLVSSSSNETTSTPPSFVSREFCGRNRQTTRIASKLSFSVHTRRRVERASFATYRLLLYLPRPAWQAFCGLLRV